MFHVDVFYTIKSSQKRICFLPVGSNLLELNLIGLV